MTTRSNCDASASVMAPATNASSRQGIAGIDPEQMTFYIPFKDLLHGF